MADKQFPVGVAQKKVLDALGITATDYQDADKKFMDYGIVVASKRGVPVVRYHHQTGSFAKKETLQKLAQWFDRGY